jgi:CBS domain-containing protein
MENLVSSIRSHQKDKLRELAVNISILPAGLDFFGRLRVERSGPDKGRFNLEQYALIPLVANVRVMALKYGIADTSTIDRLKKLMEDGRLGVELTERLLIAYQEFFKRKIASLFQNYAAGGGIFIAPEEHDEDGQLEFRKALEALINLQKLVYLNFVEQG